MTDYGIFHQVLFFTVHLFSITLFNCSTNTNSLFFQYCFVMLFTFIFMNHINDLVIVILTLNERRTMAARLFKPLQNGRYVKVSEWQKEPRVDFRQYELCNGQEIPTKKKASVWRWFNSKTCYRLWTTLRKPSTRTKRKAGIWDTTFTSMWEKKPLCGYSAILETKRRVGHCSY